MAGAHPVQSRSGVGNTELRVCFGRGFFFNTEKVLKCDDHFSHMCILPGGQETAELFQIPKPGRYQAKALPSPETTFHVSCNKKTPGSMCAVGGVWNSCVPAIENSFHIPR